MQRYYDEGNDFTTYLYVPEAHPETGDIFVEREDETHVLKVRMCLANIYVYNYYYLLQRIANHTRCGGPQQLNLQYFQEAYSDSSTGLTLAALTGTRKQSVVDAERFFGGNVASFMHEKGYNYEYRFVKTICNMRRACDERGLSELQRCKFNYEFLNLCLDELMPWHREVYDISLLQVNRKYILLAICLCSLMLPIKNVLGFSKETLAAVITNVEGREWCRRMRCTGSPEHPRASTSDDVECFFSMLCDTIGPSFTTKQVLFNFRKVAF